VYEGSRRDDVLNGGVSRSWVKVPFPDLSEGRTRRGSRGTVNGTTGIPPLRPVQTYGRSVRSETDYAVTCMLDSIHTLAEVRGLFNPSLCASVLSLSESAPRTLSTGLTCSRVRFRSKGT